MIVFARHAHALRGDDDFARVLSELGKTQAANLREVLLAYVGEPEIVICSSVERAVQTACIVSGRTKDQIIQLPSLYEAADPVLWQACRPLLMELGHASMEEYKNHSLYPKLRRMCRAAFEDLQEFLLPGKRSLIVGHDITLLMVARYFTQIGDINTLLAHNLGECGAFAIDDGSRFVPELTSLSVVQ